MGCCSWGCQVKKVTVGSWQSATRRLSLILGASGSTSRDLALWPFPLLTSFSHSRAGFPWCSVSRGARLFFHRKRLVHFLVPGSAFSSSSRGLSTSVRFQPNWLDFGSHLLERFPVTASSRRVKEHTRAPGESDLTFGIWSCFEKCQLWASSFSKKKPETEKGSGFP